MREGQERFVDWYCRPEGLVCGGRSGRGAVPVGTRQVVETGCRCAAASCQRVRREFSRGFRQVSWVVEQVGTETLPKGAFQDNDFDCATAYIGSANLTGAGIGMKGEGNSNFEAGILTDDPSLVDAAADHLDSVWQGRRCNKCKRKAFCGDRISK